MQKTYLFGGYNKIVIVPKCFCNSTHTKNIKCILCYGKLEIKVYRCNLIKQKKGAIFLQICKKK